MNDRDERFMVLALDEARTAALRGDVPIAAMVVRDGEVLSSGSNRKEKDPTAHAEVLALRGAAEVTGSWNLRGCTLYVTAEPCPMCAGALILAGVKRCVYAAFDSRYGCCGSVYALPMDPAFHHRVLCEGGLLMQEARALLDNFFAARR